MLPLTLPIFFLIASPISVLACEGQCIAGITRAWLGNYTSPLNTVYQDIAQQISQTLLSAERYHDVMSYLRPIQSAFEDDSYDGMESAIFPSYFHGKCQRNGVDPPGCPNPDCPVVCGTPGSLVHFYPKLRFIAYNYTRNTLGRLSSPGSDAYKRVEGAVLQASAEHRRRERERRRVPWFEYAITGAGGELVHGLSRGRNISHAWTREVESVESVKKELKEILRQTPSLLEKACGGHASEEENALPKCSWEERMKAYILTFP
ncbi:hypothetical protein F5148DRAFT_1275330 [Russula earlei]|uniref:Uncharacterized protein n=1 Tax=Russula earlei TaxID=71964 RepID=A0ACC0UC67_9AGAM|nr:hypothetical protein F5148DRAFT_1275330 [Russula earlei]